MTGGYSRRFARTRARRGRDCRRFRPAGDGPGTIPRESRVVVFAYPEQLLRAVGLDGAERRRSDVASVALVFASSGRRAAAARPGAENETSTRADDAD